MAEQPLLFPRANGLDFTTELLRRLNVSADGNWPDALGIMLRSWFTARGFGPTVLSLFSGAGGLDIGFHDLGFNIIEAVEIEPRFTRTLAENATGNGYLGNCSIRTMDVRCYSRPEQSIDFIIGGPPCQSFSAAGRRASGVPGLNDDRGILFREYVRLLKELQPRGFLFENVYGLTGAEGGRPFQEIVSAFQEAGYQTFARVLDVADYGVPQHRERLFIVGLKSEDFCFPKPTHGPDSPSNRPFRSAKEALVGSNEESRVQSVNGRYGHLLEGIPPGLNYSFYTAEMGYPQPVFAWRSKFSDFLYKADPERPVRTLKAYGGKYTGPFHWDSRPFSVTELKRLQTFPDEYHLVGTRQSCIVQLGNSVPPHMGRMLAYSVAQQIFGAVVPVDMPLLEDAEKLSFRKRKRELSALYSAAAQRALDAGTVARDHTVRAIQQTLTLSTDFSLQECHDSTSAVTVCVSSGKSALNIKSDSSNADTTFTLVLQPRIAWSIPYSSVTLRGAFLASSPRWDALIIGWKVLERTMQDAHLAADLVQLNGYYQYTSAVRMKLTFKGAGYDHPFAGVLQRLARGEAVASTIALTELGEMWNMPVEAVMISMSLLRNHGFEIRNWNTNPQIPQRHVLIPYPFPTLNRQSVQFHKSLQW